MPVFISVVRSLVVLEDSNSPGTALSVSGAFKEGNMKRDPWTEGYSVGVVVTFLLVNAVWIIIVLVL